jgi:hypothetical protein
MPRIVAGGRALARQVIHRVASIVGAALLAGCSVFQPAPTPTPTPTLSAQEIASRSAGRMLAVQSLHFTIELTGALDYIDSPPTIALKSVDGDLVRPDKFQTDTYVTNPINQRWEKLPPEWGWYIDPTLLFHPEYGVPAVLPTIPLDKVGVEEVDGRLYYHLNATTQGDYIAWWTLGMIPEGAVVVDAWIDTETFILRRVTLVETASDPDDPTVWHIELSAIDEPVAIEPPPIE